MSDGFINDFSTIYWDGEKQTKTVVTNADLNNFHGPMSPVVI